jgi:hypothetical protein
MKKIKQLICNYIQKAPLGLLLVLASINIANAQSVVKSFSNRMVNGFVMCNGNGVEGVAVTDGYNVTCTNKAGYYMLETNPDAKFISISTPTGYTTSRNGSRPAFYQEISKNTVKSNEENNGWPRNDFEIFKNPDEHHIFIAQADVQVTSNRELDMYEPIVKDINEFISTYVNGTYSSLSNNQTQNTSTKKSKKSKRGSKKTTNTTNTNILTNIPVASEKIDIFGVDCGDMVGDSPQLFPRYIEIQDRLNMPIFKTIGNHDQTYGGRTFETSYSTFEKYFGPIRYSFNKGQAHYIFLDDNFYIGRDGDYIGYIDETTFRWLEQDLQYVPKDKIVFLVIHMPTSLTKWQQPFQFDFNSLADQLVNAEHLYNVLAGRKTHIISGHMHYNLNIDHSLMPYVKNAASANVNAGNANGNSHGSIDDANGCLQGPDIYEHNIAAVCGTWWCGDAYPGKICLDGTPQGYAIFDVNGKDVKWLYKGAGHPDSYQAKAYLKDTASGTTQTTSSATPANAAAATSAVPDKELIANVWNYDEGWKVEWYLNGKCMGRMEQYTGNDPDAEALCSDRSKIKYDWIAPMPTEHLFRAKIPAELLSGSQNGNKHTDNQIEVVVTDRFNREYKAVVK